MVKRDVDLEIKILKAAYGIFNSDGLSKISARTIAKKAGISTYPIYSHFESINKLTDLIVKMAVKDFEFGLYSLSIKSSTLKVEVQIFRLFTKLSGLYSEIANGNKYVISECSKMISECYQIVFDNTKLFLLATLFGIQKKISLPERYDFDLEVVNRMCCHICEKDKLSSDNLSSNKLLVNE